MSTNDANNKNNGFTFDAENTASGGEIPSVTKLLNRKSLGLGAAKSEKTSSLRVPKDMFGNKETPLPSAAAPSYEAVSHDDKTMVGTPSMVAEALSPQAPSLEPAAPALQVASFEPAPPQTFAPSPTSAEPKASAPPGEISISLESPSSSGGGFELETTQRPVTEEAPASSGALPNQLPSAHITAAAAPTSTAPAQVNAAKRGARGNSEELILWNLDALKNGPDPLGQGISLFFAKGATAVLFLAITAPPAGAKLPHFVAKAAVNPKDKQGIWTGLRWDPVVVPDLWAFFVKNGRAELSPPGTMTNAMSNRNMVRGAFGVQQGEWLTLLRAGSASACRGVIAIISKGQMRDAIEQALPLIAAPLKKSA